MNRRWLSRTSRATAPTVDAGRTEPIEREGDLAPHLHGRRERADHRLLQDGKAVRRFRRGGEPLAQLDRTPPPEGLELHVRIGERADRSTQDARGAARPEVDADDRGVGARLDTEGPAVGTRDDRPAKPGGLLTVAGPLDAELVLVQVEDDLDRPARDDALLRMRRRVGQRPEVLDEPGEGRRRSVDAIDGTARPHPSMVAQPVRRERPRASRPRTTAIRPIARATRAPARPLPVPMPPLEVARCSTARPVPISPDHQGDDGPVSSVAVAGAGQGQPTDRHAHERDHRGHDGPASPGPGRDDAGVRGRRGQPETTEQRGDDGDSDPRSGAFHEAPPVPRPTRCRI